MLGRPCGTAAVLSYRAVCTPAAEISSHAQKAPSARTITQYQTRATTRMRAPPFRRCPEQSVSRRRAHHSGAGPGQAGGSAGGVTTLRSRSARLAEAVLR